MNCSLTADYYSTKLTKNISTQTANPYARLKGRRSHAELKFNGSRLFSAADITIRMGLQIKWTARKQCNKRERQTERGAAMPLSKEKHKPFNSKKHKKKHISIMSVWHSQFTFQAFFYFFQLPVLVVI